MSETGKKLGFFSVFCILIIAVVFNFESAAINPVLANISADFPDEPLVKANFIAAAPLVTSIIFSIVCGKLVGKWSKKTVVIIGLLIYGVVGIMPGFAQGINTIIILRLLTGIGVGLCLPIPAMMLADHFQGEDLKKMNGRMNFVFNIANCLVSIVVGAIAIMNWRYAFYAFAVMLVIMVLVIIGIPKDKAGKELHADKVNQQSGEKAKIGKFAVLMFIGHILIWMAFTSIILGTSYLNMERSLVPMATIGIVIALPGLFDAFAALLYPKLEKIRFYVPMALALMAVGLLLFGTASNGATFAIGAILGGFGHGLLLPLIVTQTAVRTPEAARDKALGLVQAGIHLGAVVATLIISEIVDVAPVEDGWAFVYILEVIIIAIFAVALLFKTMAGGKKGKTAEAE